MEKSWEGAWEAHEETAGSSGLQQPDGGTVDGEWSLKPRKSFRSIIQTGYGDQ